GSGLGTRKRLVFKPSTPQHDAGIRIEPPASVACATGRMPAATAAAAPPEEPPAECAGLHGFRTAPSSSDSVLGRRPNSQVLVFPKTTMAALMAMSAAGEVSVATKFASMRQPAVCRSPFTPTRSLIQ